MQILVESDASERPYWLIALLLGAAFAALAVADGRYAFIFQTLAEGLWTTIYVAVISFALASTMGLLLALASRSQWLWLRQCARFYIEVVRGLPALVILLYVTFVGAPALVDLYQWAFAGAIASGWLPDVQVRDVSNTVRGIVALADLSAGGVAAGVAPRAASAGQRLYYHGERLVAGVGVGRE